MRILACLFFFFQCAHFANAQWEQVTSFNDGFVYTLEANDNYIFAGTLSGVFRTEDPAQGWEQLSNGDPGLMSPTVKIIDNVLYGYGSFTPIVRSMDWGDSWETIDFGIGADPFVRSVVKVGDYLAVDAGAAAVYSTDDGQSWTVSMYPEFVFAPIFSDGAYAYLWNSSGTFWRTSDFENYEETALNLEEFGFTRGLATDNRLFVYKTNTFLYSEDQGITWEEVSGTDVLESGLFDVAGLAYRQGLLYATVTQGQDAFVYVSENEGDSWVEYPVPMQAGPWDFMPFNGELYGAGVYYSVAKLGPEMEPQETLGQGIHAPTLRYLNRSGNDWYAVPLMRKLQLASNQFQTVELIEPFGNDVNYDAIRMPFHSQSGAVLVAGSDQSIFYKPHGATEWTNIAGNLYADGLLFSFTQPGQFIAEGNTYLYLTNTGATFRSVNAGESWSALPFENQNGFCEALVHNNKLYIGGQLQGRLLISDDWGDTYNEEAFGFVGNILHVFANGTTIRAFTPSHIIYSDDNGDTWQTMALPNGIILRTALYSEGILLIGTSDGKIYRSDDFGDNFTMVSEGLPGSLYEMERIVRDEHNVYVNVKDGTMWRRPLAELGIITSVSENEALSERAWSVFPNPASSQVYINWPEQSRGVIRVFNTQGAMVTEKTTDAGQQSIDVSGLPVGQYILSGTNADGQSMGWFRLVIVR